MCAIVDRNAVGELLKQTHEAAKGFYQWLRDQGTLVVGGKELREALYRRSNDKERQAVNELRSAGKIIEINDSAVEKEASRKRGGRAGWGVGWVLECWSGPDCNR